MSIGKGIPLSASFDLKTKLPLDSRTVVNNISELLNMPDIIKYQGMIVYVKNENCFFRYGNDEWSSIESGFITGSGAPTFNTKVGSAYIDKDNGNLYIYEIVDRYNLLCGWKFVVNIKGPKGTGEQGPRGIRGSSWFIGTAISGAVSLSSFNTGVDALENDIYFNPITGDVYQCKVSGDQNTAKWLSYGNIKGDKGDNGKDGSLFHHGTGISGTGVDLLFFGSGVENAHKNDIYFNTDTKEMYTCTKGGSPSEAKWSYITTLNGGGSGSSPTPSPIPSPGTTPSGNYVSDIALETGPSGTFLKITKGSVISRIPLNISGSSSSTYSHDIVLLSTSWVSDGAGKFKYEYSYSNDLADTMYNEDNNEYLIPDDKDENILKMIECNVKRINLDTVNNKMVFSATTIPNVDIKYTSYAFRTIKK